MKTREKHGGHRPTAAGGTGFGKSAETTLVCVANSADGGGGGAGGSPPSVTVAACGGGETHDASRPTETTRTPTTAPAMKTAAV